MPDSNYAAYVASDPYFNLVRGALGDLVDGKHFFDIVADDIVYEVLYELGWPRVGLSKGGSISWLSSRAMETALNFNPPIR